MMCPSDTSCTTAVAVASVSSPTSSSPASDGATCAKYDQQFKADDQLLIQTRSDVYDLYGRKR
eukprot:CAMPEP_0206295564 /NCGR_PEP_ID=MMETSP0106_2-20121207/5230_1 /ASSEMBLY_ACC=CAM_ASM_000206 /TAXON_ID=81532 /ORGANISM="Acanthoeca-like sp., Strain 10tr" /LENGTH=62 /DNA_ID=CAMNT_0053726219 /DNA_START=442 /DNA_END=628 /DNA_ORIENTATION=-